MLIGKNGIDLIRTWEGMKLTAYRDVAGILTIGIGHTGPDVTEGLKITQKQAEDLFMRDIEWVESVLQRVMVPLTHNMFDALCAWVYNIGANAAKTSTLLVELNLGHYWKIPSELAKWNRSGGKVVQGLINRRQAEIELFCEPDA